MDGKTGAFAAARRPLEVLRQLLIKIPLSQSEARKKWQRSFGLGVGARW